MDGCWHAPLILRLYGLLFALSNFGFSSNVFSKKFTSDCSVRREASMCSKDTTQSASLSDRDGVGCDGVLAVSEKTQSWSEEQAPFSESKYSSEALPEPILMLRCPTSPIWSNRVVTVAMAWYSSFSSGSSWNRLYKVLQNCINSLWGKKKKKGTIWFNVIILHPP